MKLIEYLKSHNLSVSAFAVKAKIEQSTAWRTVNRQTVPTIEIALRIVEATDGAVTIKDLLKN